MMQVYFLCDELENTHERCGNQSFLILAASPPYLDVVMV